MSGIDKILLTANARKMQLRIYNLPGIYAVSLKHYVFLYAGTQPTVMVTKVDNSCVG